MQIRETEAVHGRERRGMIAFSYYLTSTTTGTTISFPSCTPSRSCKLTETPRRHLPDDIIKSKELIRAEKAARDALAAQRRGNKGRMR